MNEEIEVIPGGAVLTGRNAQENSKQEPPRKALPPRDVCARERPWGRGTSVSQRGFLSRIKYPQQIQISENDSVGKDKILKYWVCLKCTPEDKQFIMTPS